jgi:hypothetical protein
MNKTLKFKSHYVSFVIAPEKEGGITTRVFDDKSLSEGDEVDFLNDETNERFATARITKIEETAFGEYFEKNQPAELKGMYEQYEAYHNKKVTPDTAMKIIHYKFIEKVVPQDARDTL